MENTPKKKQKKMATKKCSPKIQTAFCFKKNVFSKKMIQKMSFLSKKKIFFKNVPGLRLDPALPPIICPGNLGQIISGGGVQGLRFLLLVTLIFLKKTAPVFQKNNSNLYLGLLGGAGISKFLGGGAGQPYWGWPSWPKSAVLSSCLGSSGPEVLYCR